MKFLNRKEIELIEWVFKVYLAECDGRFAYDEAQELITKIKVITAEAHKNNKWVKNVNGFLQAIQADTTIHSRWTQKAKDLTLKEKK